MKLLSWNVNGFRAVLGKGFSDYFAQTGVDCFGVQEIKMLPGQADFSPEGYHCYWNSAERKGYSGTALFSRTEPLQVEFGIDGRYTDEGRLITAEYPDFYFLVCYAPNSQHGLTRLDYRLAFNDALRAYLVRLDRLKPVVLCGDLNVAHSEIDLKNPKENIGNACFTYEERAKMTELLESGFADSFRALHPDKTDAYSWWSFRANARARNIGWRIDYFIVSQRALPGVRQAYLCPEVLGSDHCPVGLEIEF